MCFFVCILFHNKACFAIASADWKLLAEALKLNAFPTEKDMEEWTEV